MSMLQLNTLFMHVIPADFAHEAFVCNLSIALQSGEPTARKKKRKEKKRKEKKRKEKKRKEKKRKEKKRKEKKRKESLMVQCCNLPQLLVQQSGPLLSTLKWVYTIAQTRNGQQLPNFISPLLLGALKPVTLRSGSAFLGISWN